MIKVKDSKKGIKRKINCSIKRGLKLFICLFLSFSFIFNHYSINTKALTTSEKTGSTSYGRWVLNTFINISGGTLTAGNDGVFSATIPTAFSNAWTFTYHFNNLYSGTITLKMPDRNYINQSKSSLQVIGFGGSIQQINTTNYTYTLRLEECLSFQLVVPLSILIDPPSSVVVTDSLSSVVPSATRLTQIYSQLQTVNSRLSTTNATLSSILTQLQNMNSGSGGNTSINFKQWFRDYSISANAFLSAYTKSNAVLNSNGQYITQSALAQMQDSYYSYEYVFNGWNTRDSYYTHARSFSVKPKTTQYFLIMTSVRLISNDGSNTITPRLYSRFNDSAFNGSNWGQATNWTIDYIDRNGSYLIYLFTINNDSEYLQDVSIDFGWSSFTAVPLYLGSDYNVPKEIETLIKIDSEDKYTVLLNMLIDEVRNMSGNSSNVSQEELQQTINNYDDTSTTINNIETMFSDNFENQKVIVDNSIDSLNSMPFVNDVVNAGNFVGSLFGGLFGAVPWLEYVLILILFLALVLSILG